MSTVGQTLLRFAGAVLLGGAATAIDQPSLFRTPAESSSVSVLASGRVRLTPNAPQQQIGITPGKRAMGLRIVDAASIAGAAKPNSRVDVIFVARTADGQTVARLFLENMRLLAIGPIPNGAVVATLEVTPEEAQRLAVALTQGEMRLILRGNAESGAPRAPSAPSRDSLSRRRP